MFGFPVNSSRSASKRIVSNNSETPTPVFDEIATQGIDPPNP